MPKLLAILSTHLLHEFIMNAKCRMNRSYRKTLYNRYACRSISWNNILPMEHVCLLWICSLFLTSLKDLNSPWLILSHVTLIFLRMFLVADFYQSFLLNDSPQFKKNTRANPVSSTTINISAFKVKLRDQFRFLGKRPPTPPLRQHFALSEK